MTRNSPSLFLSITVLLLALPAAQAQVVITEIMYDPTQSTDTGYEWIEIQNQGEDAVLIEQLKLVEGGVKHTIFAEKEEQLPPAEVAVIAQNRDSFLSVYPDYKKKLFRSNFSLRQKDWTGETLALQFGEGETDRFWYTYTPDAKANGTGATVHIHGAEQIIAPATPGEVAVNPIDIPEEAPPPEKEPNLEEQVKEMLTPPQIPTPPPPTPKAPSVTPPPPLSLEPIVVDLPDYRPHLSIAIGVLALLAFEGYILILLLSLFLKQRQRQEWGGR